MGVHPEDDSRYAAVSGTSAITVNAPAGKTYNVGGTVLEYGITDSSEQPLAGAVVTIRRGMDIYGQSQATDADGHFHIGQLLPGTYNAVIAYSGKTVTAKLQIVDKDAVLTVRIPARMSAASWRSRTPPTSRSTRWWAVWTPRPRSSSPTWAMSPSPSA